MNLAKNFYKSTKASVIGSSDVEIMVLHFPCLFYTCKSCLMNNSEEHGHSENTRVNCARCSLIPLACLQVKEATNSDPFGPAGATLSDLSDVSNMHTNLLAHTGRHTQHPRMCHSKCECNNSLGASYPHARSHPKLVEPPTPDCIKVTGGSPRSAVNTTHAIRRHAG